VRLSGYKKTPRATLGYGDVFNKKLSKAISVIRIMGYGRPYHGGLGRSKESTYL
jgi:hypothetical protein